MGSRDDGRASRTMMPTPLIHNACGSGPPEDRLEGALHGHFPKA
ncbi:hypothetical protein BN2537_14443 [Streptomyces venezuelae]|nr:hypothetical protein BN2537_14443 [Streptomyces venezuelae]